MTWLDFDRLDSLDAERFRRTKPYPWVNPRGLLHERAFEELRSTLPDVSCFTPSFDQKREYGQATHDRFALEYAPELELAEAWRGFVAELRGERYRAFLHRMLGVRRVALNFHWHYTPAGCSVSPHCDSRRKLASHLFYMNEEEEWDPSWGGQTLVLDDGGRLPRDSSPDFDDFEGGVASETLGNRSVLFATTAHSWHGMRPLSCPEDALRKVFIVVVNRADGWRRIKRRLKGKATPTY